MLQNCSIGRSNTKMIGYFNDFIKMVLSELNASTLLIQSYPFSRFEPSQLASTRVFGRHCPEFARRRIHSNQGNNPQKEKRIQYSLWEKINNNSERKHSVDSLSRRGMSAGQVM